MLKLKVAVFLVLLILGAFVSGFFKVDVGQFQAFFYFGAPLMYAFMLAVWDIFERTKKGST